MTTLPESITVSDDDYSLPISELMTGRGAAFGKSGSGKSNSISVVAEELLALGLPIVVIDIEGEYWGLTERFDVTYAGTGSEADVEPSLDTVERLVSSVLVDNRPLVFDLSGITDADVVDELLTTFVTRLFEAELQAQKPCLLFVEEIHEFLPQSGRSGDLADVLIKVAKRGRKRGLGLCGISQRPAAVDKEFITQCEWIVWHRLTWENDTKVVEKILGREQAETVKELDTGEALVMTDWDESLTRTKFRRKDTLDAGATPDLTAFAEADLRTSPEPSPDSGDEAAPSSRKTTTHEPSESALSTHETDVDDDTSAGRDESPVQPPSDSFDPLEEAAFFLIHVGSAVRRQVSNGFRRVLTAGQSGTVTVGQHGTDPALDAPERRRFDDNVVNALIFVLLVVFLLVLAAIVGLL